MQRIKGFIYPEADPEESGLVGEEVIKLNPDGTRNWAGVPDRDPPWEFDVLVDGEEILEIKI